MNSSGIKRGLAGSAVAALAVTGLPFLATSASATPIAGDFPAPNDVVTTADYALLNPDSAPAQVTTSAYNIVVGANADVAAIQIRFTPTAGTEAVVAQRVERVNGAFSYAWTPNASGTLTVVPFDASGDLVEGQAVTNAVNANLPGNSDTATIGGDVNLGVWNTKATAAGGNDYTVGITGTTSMTDTTASALDDGFQVVVEARTGVAATSEVEADVVGATSGTFGGVLPLDGYVFTPGGPDQLVVGAEPQDAVLGVDGPRVNIEDAAVKTLYLQQLASVTAEAEGNNLPPGETTEVTVTAVDQLGAPIAGAEVFRSTNGGGAVSVGTTGADGTLVDDGGSGLGSGSYKYFVNAPAGAVDNPQATEEAALGDKSSTVAISVYTPELTAVQVASRWGTVADLDEVDGAGAIALKAVDQNGNAVGNVPLHYTWTVTPFDGSPALTTTEQGPVTTNNTPTPAKGTATVDMADITDFSPALTSLPSGKWTLKVYRKPVGGNGAFNAAPADFKFGQAAVEWTPGDVQAAKGGSATIKGTLQLEDGTALGSIDYPAPEVPFADVNRTANLAFTPGTEQDDPATPVIEGGAGDSRIAPISEQDSTVKTVPVGGLSGTVQFNAAGVINVKVNDANPETLEELDAELDATTTGDLGGGTTSVEVDFLNSVSAESVTGSFASVESVDGVGTSGFPTPGRPGVVEFLVKNASGQTLSGKTVEVSVNGNAFFTDNVTGPYTTAQKNGVFANKGKTATVTTDASGIARVTVAIERSAGLDDDFSDTVAVSAGVDGKSGTQNVVFKAWDAVDLDSVEVTPVASNTANLPDAQVGFEDVEYNVTAKDQFGNLSRESFDAEDGDNGLADLNYSGTTANSTTNGNLEAYADAATTQNITVTVGDRNGAAADSTVVEEVAPINWYEIDFAASTFALGQTGAESVEAGTRVTEVLTATDQKGHAIQGLDVRFLRSGPGDEDSDGNWTDTTDAQGRAFYDFTGGVAGTARISAVVTVGGTRVGAADDTVTFTGTIEPEKAGINLKASGANNGGKADKLKVNAKNNAAGLVAKVFVKGKQVASHKLNSSGDFTFTVKDKNGNKATKYVVKVSGSATTKSGKASASIR